MKLPEIEYNPNGVRPLAKEDTSLPMRAAQTEIGLSKVKLQSELDLSQIALSSELDKVGKIGQAGIRVARENLATDQHLNQAKAQIATAVFSHRVDQKAIDRNFKLQMANTAVQWLGKKLDEWLDGKNDKEAGEAKLDFAKSMSMFQMDNAGVESYEAPQLPDSVYNGPRITTAADGSTTPIKLSRNEIFPELWKAHAEDSIEKSSLLISNDALRDQFKQAATLDVQGHYVALVNDSIKAQRSEMVSQQGAQVEALYDEGQYDLGLKYLEETSIPEAKKIEYRSKIGIKKEEVGYHQVLAGDNIKQIVTAADYLESKDYQGRLSAESRFGWSQKLKVKAVKLQETNNDMQVALKSEATEISRAVLGDMVQGKGLDQANIAQVIAYAEKNDVDPGLVRNLRKEASQLYVNQAFHATDANGRANIIRNLDNSATTPPDRMLAQRYARENERITKALREDPLQYAHDQDLYKLDPFQPNSPEFWRNRKLQASAVSDRFKVKTPLLTATEAQQVADHFEKSTPSDKVALVQDLQKHLGDDAERVLDQVGTKNPAFRVLSLVEPRAAIQAINGAEIRKEYPAAVPKRQDVQHELTDHFGNVLVTNPKMREGLEQFTLDLYASKVAKTGDMTGEFNKKIMREALKEVPLIEYQDQKFIAPPGVDTKAFKAWIKNAEPAALIGGKVPHMADDEVVKRIKNGDFPLLQVSRNEWYLLDKESGRVISTDGRQPFVLRYDPDLPYRGTYGFPYDQNTDPTKKKKTVGDILREGMDKLEGIF